MRTLAVLAALADGGAARAYPRRYPDLPTLPETVRGTVAVPIAAEQRPGSIATLREIFPALAACWQVPDGLAGIERGEVTLRLSLRRDGSVQGTPRVTFNNLSVSGEARNTLTRAALDAIRRCTPLPLTDGLGAAVAGRPLALRFVYDGPKGRGI